MKLFAAACLASAFSETNIENEIERFRREARYETIPFLDSKNALVEVKMEGQKLVNP